MKFPETLDIIASDLGGNYCDGRDCAIARALIRLGVPFGRVSGWGYVGDLDGNEVQYKWEDGTTFTNADNTGRLVLCESLRATTD